MARAYAAAAGTHMFFGLLCMAAGTTWICLLYFYEPLFKDGESYLGAQPEWVSALFAAKIFCGFWFFITGAVGFCINSRGCAEGVFVALNILNVIIWAPVLLLLMVAFAYFILFGTAVLQNSSPDFDLNALTDATTMFGEYPWLWAFPAVGVLVGLVEFVLSIVSYSIVCCCRPSQLNETSSLNDERTLNLRGYEYQYEMK